MDDMPGIVDDLSEEDKKDPLKRLSNLEHRIRNLEQGHVSLSNSLKTNTTMTAKIERDTATLVEIFTFVDNGTKQGAKWFLRIISIIKWLGGIAIAVSSIFYVYTIFKTGGNISPQDLHK